MSLRYVEYIVGVIFTTSGHKKKST